MWDLRFVDVLTLIALILGPCIAVGITFWYQKRIQVYAAKERLFLTLMAHRKSFPPTLDWANALNLIDVVYGNHPKVLKSWSKCYDLVCTVPLQQEAWNHNYLDLLSEMAQALGYLHLRQTQIDQFYVPQIHGEQAVLSGELQAQLLRILRATHNLDALLATPPTDGQAGG